MSIFSRVTLAPEGFRHSGLVSSLCSDAYGEHQSIWTLFGSEPTAKRSFIFRKDESYAGLRYFVISEKEPMNPNGIWGIESKQYDPVVQAGDMCYYDLRVNPVIKRTDGAGKTKKHDVVMDLKKRNNVKSQHEHDEILMSEITHQAGFNWLNKRAERLGVELDEGSFSAEGYLQRSAHKKGNDIRYSTIDLKGMLKVMDPEKFRFGLRNGIGAAKAFGCGMMLIRRVT